MVGIRDGPKNNSTFNDGRSDLARYVARPPTSKDRIPMSGKTLIVGAVFVLLGSLYSYSTVRRLRYSLSTTDGKYCVSVEDARFAISSRREPKTVPGTGQTIGYQTGTCWDMTLFGYRRRVGFVGWELPDGSWFPTRAVPNCEINECWVSLTPPYILSLGLGFASAIVLCRTKKRIEVKGEIKGDG